MYVSLKFFRLHITFFRFLMLTAKFINFSLWCTSLFMAAANTSQPSLTHCPKVSFITEFLSWVQPNKNRQDSFNHWSPSFCLHRFILLCNIPICDKWYSVWVLVSAFEPLNRQLAWKNRLDWVFHQRSWHLNEMINLMLQTTHLSSTNFKLIHPLKTMVCTVHTTFLLLFFLIICSLLFKFYIFNWTWHFEGTGKIKTFDIDKPVLLE